MSHKNNSKKIIVIALVIIIISSAFLGNINSVYGRINETYSAGDTTGSIDVEKAVSDSDILDSIAHFIYAIACFIEKIIASVIAGFSGADVFPWADRVIFNTMPFLDINFLSPAPGSMFEKLNGGGPTIFGTIIRNMYYTIFVLSLAFFGVVVGVMAMKLAISSIASEKAKYKQAITNWLFALILIFTTHYLISFIFFVNEKMVEIAGIILKTQVEDVNFEIDVSGWSDDEYARIVKLLKENFNSNALLNVPGVWNESGKITSIKGDVELEYKFEPGSLLESGKIEVKSVKVPDGYKDDDVKKIFNRQLVTLLTTSDYMKNMGFTDWKTEEFLKKFTKPYVVKMFEAVENTDVISNILKDAVRLTAEEISSKNLKKEYNVTPELAAKYSSTQASRDAFGYVYSVSIGNSDVQKKDMFTNMAAFFRNNVYTFKRDDDGKIASSSASDFTPIPALLYSIFVIQSIMYFISYLKRFFYIIVLALFAPLVIIYDFLTKTSMG